MTILQLTVWDTLNKNINTTLFLISYMQAKCLFHFHLVHKFVKICISEHFTFAKLIHPPGMWDTSRCWLKSRITGQVTTEGHSKICSSFMKHDAIHFEETCNWFANCRNVHQSWTECSLYHLKSRPTISWVLRGSSTSFQSPYSFGFSSLYCFDTTLETYCALSAQPIDSYSGARSY